MNKMLTRSLALIGLTLALSLTSEARNHRSPSRILENAAKSLQDLRDASVAPPKDLEVCFSPDEPCGAKLTKFIAGAVISIDVAIYDINLDAYVHQLIVKSKQIPVRIVVDRKQAKGPHSAVKLLQKAGIRLKYGRQRGIMHNKFVIVDGKQVETGSFNHTHHASTANNENQIYLFEPKVVARYQARFEKLWREGDDAGS